MEEKKNSKGLIWLIFILIALVLGLVGYIVYDKVLIGDKDNVEQNTTTTITTTKNQNDKVGIGEIDDADVQYLFDNFVNAPVMKDSCYRYEYNFNTKEELKFDDLTQDEKLMLLINYEHKTNKELNENIGCGNEFVEISEDKLLETWKKIFGNREMTLDNHFYNDYVSFEKSDNNKYKAYFCNGGFGCEGSSRYNFLEYKKNEMRIEIKVEYEEYPYENSEVNTNELSQYKFIFVKSESDYIFDKILKLK